MSNIPPLNYFMEQEEARAATNNFRLILQDVFKEYKKVWNMYINLVKKCEESNSRSVAKDKSKTRQNGGNYKRTVNTYISEQDITNSFHSMEDVLAHCTLDLNSSTEESNGSDKSEKIGKDVPASPIFRRNNSNSAMSAFKKSNSKSGSSSSIVADDNLSDNEQENSDRIHTALNASSMTNISSIFLCSTPKKSQKWSKSKRQNVKRNTQSKKIRASGSVKKKNNLVSIRKEKTNKVPLRIINNVASIQKNNQQIDKNNSNRSYNIQVTMSPNSRKLKQTKLVFHKTKKTVELSNNLKSTNVSPVTKINTPVSNQDKILRQSTLTNNPNEKELYNEYSGNTNDRVEASKDVPENNFIYIQTNPEIKNEVILQQEYEQSNQTEINDPLNISDGSDSTFFEDNECNMSMNKNNDDSSDSDKTYISIMKNNFKTINENVEKRHISSLETEQNIVEVNDTEQPIKKKRLAKLENEKCNECKQNNKRHCSHNKSMAYRMRNILTSTCTLLPDSSTT